MLLAQAASSGVSLWPFAVLAISVGTVIVLITMLRVHAFIALILAAILAGLLAEQLPGARPRKAPPTAPQPAQMPAGEKPLRNHWVMAVELTTIEFGKTAGAIGLVIGLASIISMSLMESGAADKVVRRFLAVFGEKRASLALLWSTYVLSIPIFFDTMFMLMVPLAKALRLRTGKDYLLYVLVICCGAVITHSLTVPHPGPLAMVDNLKVDVGFSIMCGIVGGIIPAFAGWLVARWINRRIEVPLRETPGAPLQDLETIASKPESELPPFLWSILPIILPIALISVASLMDVAGRDLPGVVSAFGGRERFAQIYQWFELVGNRNVALLIGAVVSLYVLARQKRFGFREIEELIGPPLQTAGIIILITSAGGAFGLMLKNAGVGEAIKAVAAGREVNLVLLAWLVAFVIRVAQGSATVAMLTASAMIFPMIDPMQAGAMVLPFHPIYIFMAIGFGAFACSWMNDSGFWVVSKLGGMTEAETLKSWTVMLTAVSLVGLLIVLAGAAWLPLVAKAP